MFLRQLKEGPTANLTYIIADGEGGAGAVIDPAGDAQKLIKTIENEGLAIELVLITHGHPDHTSGVRKLVNETRARVAAHRLANIKKDLALEDGARLRLGSLELEVLHTPGHTRDSVCFLAGRRLFTGDTLFVGECGRTDLPGGDAGAMYESLFNRILKLSDDIEIYPGHDYGPRPTSTIGQERRTNYTLQPRAKDEFIEFMAEP